MSLCERERMMMMYLCKGVHFPPSRLKFYPWDHQFALLMFTQKTVCVWLFLRVKTLWNISVAHAFRRQLIHHRVKDVDRETLKNHTFLCLLYSWGWLNEVSSARQGCIFLITNLHWRCSKHSKHFNCIVSTANAAHVQQAHHTEQLQALQCESQKNKSLFRNTKYLEQKLFLHHLWSGHAPRRIQTHDLKGSGLLRSAFSVRTSSQKHYLAC